MDAFYGGADADSAGADAADAGKPSRCAVLLTAWPATEAPCSTALAAR